jgi:arginine decarboxylase
MAMTHEGHPRAYEGGPVLSGAMSSQPSTFAPLASVGLSVVVIPATGHGPTRLAAFDAALRGAGVANFNLVRLSSVIPPGTTVLPGETGSDRPIDLRLGGPSRRSVPGAWGDRLYAVWAFQSAELLGQEAWAGVAWSQDPSDGRGLFVEHEGTSEAQVREELEASLESICAARGMDHLERHFVVTGTRCEGEPVAALVIAPYETAGWG